MASSNFFPVPTSIAVNGIPNTTIRWEDLNVNNFLVSISHHMGESSDRSEHKLLAD